MTALEQKLTMQLELQQEAFIAELKQITASYQENMREAKSAIEKQSQTLKRYEDVSTNWQISINQEQLDELERKQSERVQNLTEQLAKHQDNNQLLANRMQDLKENSTEQLGELERKLEQLAKQDEDLVQQLNDVLIKL